MPHRSPASGGASGDPRAGRPDAYGPPGREPDPPYGAAFGSESEGGLADAVGTLPAELPEPVATLETELSLWAVVFAGGIGSRFWPLSTPSDSDPNAAP